ncbi:ribosomal protein L17 [Aeromonas veronii]|uniref:BT4734/BF3469 family protein n=1 Tax=Aeromonas veronii TaxID=654 RepID=UPI00160C219C|nr:BT4734/BF3469 family protein [Aeromonas veronii]MCS3833433.1 ribosomal protein L17 [Aeromonas veronii]
MSKQNEILVSLKLSQYEIELSEHSIEKLIMLMRSDYLKEKTEEIRNTEDKDTRNKLKNELPIVFFNNRFHDRNQGSAIYLPKDCYGIMVMDLDEYDESYVRSIANQIRESSLWPYVLFMFRSPSGGLKFAIKTDVTKDDNLFHTLAYQKIMKLLERMDITCEFDDKCKNINRGTYLTHDAKAYYNGNCRTLALAERVQKEYENQKKSEQQSIEMMKLQLANSDGIDVERARAWYDKEVQKIIDQTVTGFRHQNAYTVAVTAFGIGLDESDALRGLYAYKLAGKYVDSMSLENKVREVKKHWQSNGAKVSNTFLKQSKEQRQAYLKSLFV